MIIQDLTPCMYVCEERVRGSHHIFRKEEVVEKVNLQREGNKAKPYQVKQTRNVIIKYKLGGK